MEEMHKLEPITHVKGVLHPCCADEENLGPYARLDATTVYRRCKICNRRHFKMLAETGHLGLKF